jgi:hypothetical protein
MLGTKAIPSSTHTIQNLRSTKQTASDEVVPHPDMLAPFMKNRVLCQGQSGLAVHPEFHRFSVSAIERCHLRILGAGDHQVVDVDTHRQGVSSIAPPVDGRLVRALPEAHPLERGV